MTSEDDGGLLSLRARLLASRDLIQTGKLQEAVTSLHDLSTENPTSASVQLLFAQALSESGRLEEALSAVQVATTLRSDFGLAWVCRASILESLERFEDASRCYVTGGHLLKAAQPFTLAANLQFRFDLTSALASVDHALRLDPAWEDALRVRVAIIEEMERRGRP